jgi:hypothetical protein
MSSYRIVPNKFKFKAAEDLDSIVNVNFSSSTKELVEFDKNTNIDLADLSIKERNNSTKYRPTVKLNFIYNNAYTGTTDYVKYKNALFFEYTDNLNIRNEYGYVNSYEFDFFRPPINVDYDVYDSSIAYKYNWSYCYTYPFDEIDKELSINLYGKNIKWMSSNGIPFISEHIKINGKDYMRLKCGVKHGISLSEYISVTINGIERIIKVASLGDENYGLEDYIINIDIIDVANPIVPNDYTGTLKRVIAPDNIEETKSSYYIRRHKVIKSIEQINGVKAGYEKNIYDSPYSLVFYETEIKLGRKNSNLSYNFTLDDDIDLGGLVDNKKRPITELYFSITHKGMDGLFNNPSNNTGLKEGWEFNITKEPNTWWDLPASNTNALVKTYVRTNPTPPSPPASFNFFYNRDYKVDDYINGDFCEWNISEQKERVISEYYHKIKHNPEIFKIGNQKNGYYYKPHNKITIKVFSDYIERGSRDDVDNIPNYAVFSKKTNEFIWRDLYDVGYFDENTRGVNYPFLNDAHYPFSYFIFRLTHEGYSYENKISGTTENQKPIIDECE